MATLAQRLEEFRERHWMRLGQASDHDLLREAVEALGGPAPETTKKAKAGCKLAHCQCSEIHRGPDCFHWRKA